MTHERSIPYKTFILQKLYSSDRFKKQNGTFSFRKCAVPHTNAISRGNHRIKDYPATTYWS